ncbi:dihydrolipoamide acetyltransferase family protein [Nocardioides mesophilus]|uniref:Dihydrolipoamide acetyltransferase component of pyruvate dehydrogenase complex n=1 Tax=Nocardioides mesophilus TaxID=433659 RepID=A0A7G9RFA4_9ACTN|nr:dihydrolipoamide acetyltransferase family protein [Nocardioides mesophilus]QNN54279.1 2-oxo acid dehydrogenase subunit E2 [Nocardioides mesophilus]
MNEYKLPDVGEGLTEAEIVTWKVKVGDVIKINDIVVEIETAKSLVELPSPYAGTIAALLVPEGETVAVGTPIIRISDGSEAPETAGATPPADVTPAAAGAPLGEIDMSNPAATGGGENQTLVGYGPREGAAHRRPRRGGASPSSEAGAAAQLQVQGAFGQGGAESSEVVEADEPAVPATPAAAPAAGPAATRVLAKPPVRKLAKDLGIDLASLAATGPHGTVSRADVEAAASGGATGAATETAPAAATTTASFDGAARERREPIKGVRKMMAQAMVDSAFSAPHVTEWVTVDVTKTMRLVERLKHDRAFAEVKVSPLLVVAKACMLAMRRVPELNATWDEAAQEVVFKSYVNLGIAAATPRGLVVPNVKDAQALSMVELGGAINALARTAREGRTQPAEMAGGTFTITNVGVFGVDAGTPIINPGESAILCFGAVREQPWVHKGKIKVRSLTTLALSFDHRLIDGEKGSRFLSDVAAILEDPATALLH